jgi:hypothetical protein
VNKPPAGKNSGIVPAYAEAFVRRCHECIMLGHGRLDPAVLSVLEETDITGHLVDAIEAALNSSDAPTWATNFTAIDDQPESVGDKTGKRRPRVDVTLRCINPRPSSNFRFEAKRLNSPASLGQYLGDEGMLSLIAGHYGTLRMSGMLGYVQCDTCESWGAQIRQKITTESAAYKAASPVRFQMLGVGTPECFACEHRDGVSERPQVVTHTLLAAHGRAASVTTTATK